MQPEQKKPTQMAVELHFLRKAGRVQAENAGRNRTGRADVVHERTGQAEGSDGVELIAYRSMRIK